MAKALCFLIFAAFAWQVRGLELDGLKNAVHHLFSESKEDDVVAERFKCGPDGLYVNPRNCSTFIQCSNGIPHVMPCPKGLHFSNKTQKCEGPCDAHCDNAIACRCNWPTCVKETCFLPPKTGPCLARFPRWYFNKREGVCKNFTYGGCRGNENNFETKQECEKRCGNAIDICRLPSEKGPCLGSFPRFFFNHKTGQCESFTYGGCRGNGNNFETKEKCEQRCLKKHEEEDAELESLLCIKDGLYPNRRNCSSFIQCTNGRPVVMPCPSGLHFSVKTQQCERPCDAHCDRTQACKCQWKTCGKNLSCRLPSRTGPCRAHIPRYYFDKRAGVCKRFVYGGCDGNENNFEKKEDCEKTCGNSIDVCKLPKEVGPCKALIPRWWYNDKTKQCEQFNYGGCQGNKNNFATKELCERRCSKKAEEEDEEVREEEVEDSEDLESLLCIKDGLYPNRRNCSSFIQCTNGRPVVMPCPSGLHFSFKTKQCERPCDAHCDRTLACKCQWKTCGLKLSCSLPPKTGPCRGNFPRYYFDKRSGVCKKFVYGGCRGNENNFEEKEDCEKYCCNICKLPMVVGPCKAAIPRWWYNSGSKTCQNFTYGGCKGNANNFATKEECEQRCPQKPEADPVPKYCSLPAEKGPCKANIEKFYYDSEEGECKNFTYGGCGGNLNSFYTKELCEKKCKRDKASEEPVSEELTSEEAEVLPPDCESPPDAGKCDAKILRWYYNKKLGKCLRFTYGGCGGNGNNYKTKEDCLKHCSKHAEPLECPEKNGDFPYFPDCQKFIRCKGGVPELKDCPKGKAFHFILRECVPEKEAACVR